MSTYSRWTTSCLMALLAFVHAPRAMAIDSATGGFWTNPATWSGSAVPSDGQAAVILSPHSVTVDVSSANLNALTVNAGGTLVFSGPATLVTATTVTVDGTITHLPESAATTNASGQWIEDHRLWLVCTDLTVSASGTIHADGRGYMGGTNSSMGGAGPGGDKPPNSYRGGTHGSVGTGSTKATYGSITMPVDPGSGGGAYDNTYLGGNGGGVIRINATGQVTVNGSISARGNLSARGGGGSGGSVLIHCQTIAGNGSIIAAGGRNTQGYSSAAGGGGRIAVIYDSAAQLAAGDICRVVFSVRGAWGAGGAAFSETWPGTLYLSDSQFFPYTNSSGNFAFCTVGATSAWQRAAISMTNGYIWLTGMGSGTITNAILIQGYATTKAVQEQPVTFRHHTDGDLSCASMMLTNGGAFIAGGVETAGVLSVSGNIDVFTNSALYLHGHLTNGSTPRLSAQRITVWPGGTLSGTGRGYGGKTSSGGAYGPGKGGTGGLGGGGGHGGEGSGTWGGSTYGSSNAPVTSGSGGGWRDASFPGGDGGSAVHVVCRLLTVDGNLVSDGGAAPRCGGGAGGSLWIEASKLAGAGTISARGGASSSGYNESPGGGGRIAVWYTDKGQWTGSLSYPVSVTNGTGVNAGAEPGTLVWVHVPAKGTMIMLL